jgi:small conductance mechanosensitive channel
VASPGAATPSLFTTAPILVDGFPVVQIAALAVPPAGSIPLPSREFSIDNAIAQLLATSPDGNETIYDPATFHVSVDQENGQYALVATDARHKTPFPILTVTSEDAHYASLSPQELANQWQGTFQTALVKALERRQPATLKRNQTIMTRIAIGLAIVTVLGIIAFFTVKRRGVAIAIAWVVTLVWFGAVTFALWLFPETLSYGQLITRSAIKLISIVVVALVADWLLGYVVAEGVRALAVFGVAPGAQARSLLRVPTMSRALNGFKRFLIVFIAMLAALSVLQIPIASVVTIGGIAAVAVGFAAQSLVRDFLNGLLVLFEDQYVVGDYIAIGAFNGIVEQFTLRVVQIRDSQGNLVTIPHSNVTQVVNSSRNWSRIDYKLSLDPGADIQKAVETLKATIDSIKNDPQWKGAILESYEWIGIDSISKSFMLLRAVVRTAPLRQFDVRREINARVGKAFEQAQVPLGFDQATTLITPMTQSPDPS